MEDKLTLPEKLQKQLKKLKGDIMMLEYDLSHSKHKGTKECIKAMLHYAYQRQDELLAKIRYIEAG